MRKKKYETSDISLLEIASCNVIICSLLASEDCMRSRGENYRGKISITESGHTCRRWPPRYYLRNDPLPPEHSWNILTKQNVCFCSFYVGGVEENYCRNPNGYPRPWCYSTNPFNYWEYCSIPQCSKIHSCQTETSQCWIMCSSFIGHYLFETTYQPTVLLEITCFTGDGIQCFTGELFLCEWNGQKLLTHTA